MSAVSLLIQKLVGQDNIISVPRLFIQATGDFASAVLLAQIVYWNDKVNGRAFYKTDEDFEQEICLSAYQLGRCRNNLKEFGVSYKRKGIPAKLHYELDTKKLENKLLSFLVTGYEVSKEQVPIETKELIQETTHQITHETTTVKDIPSSKNQDLVHPTPNNLLDNPYYTAWNENCGQLPLVTSNKEADKLIRRELKTKSKADLVEAITQGARVVSQDSFWLERRYGLVNLLRHLDSKVEVSKDGRSGANAKVQSLATGIYGALND